MPVRIFLAGATGAIGRALVPLLVSAGHDVAGTTRFPPKAAQIQSLGARPVVLDVFDRDAVFASIRAERPDAIIHQLTDLSAFDLAANARLRVTGTRNLVDAALVAGVHRVVAQSLAFVYAPGSDLAREEDPIDDVAGVPALEAAVGEVSEGVILRYGSLYGPGTWYARDGLFADRVHRRELVATDGVTSFTHVADAARAALLALDWPDGTVNVVDDEPAAGKVWLPDYAAILGAPPPPVQDGSAPRERGASNAKARNLLGWEPLYATWRNGFRAALG